MIAHLSVQASLHMKYLDLSHNEFGEAGGELLGSAIGEEASHWHNPHTLSLHCVCMVQETARPFKPWISVGTTLEKREH